MSVRQAAAGMRKDRALRRVHHPAGRHDGGFERAPRDQPGRAWIEREGSDGVHRRVELVVSAEKLREMVLLRIDRMD